MANVNHSTIQQHRLRLKSPGQVVVDFVKDVIAPRNPNLDVRELNRIQLDIYAQYGIVMDR